MTHAQFVFAIRNGTLVVDIEPKAATRFVAARMWLPWFLLPLFGLAVGLALNGRFFFGAMALASALLLRALVAKSAASFVLQRAIADPDFFAAARAANLLRFGER